MPGQPSHPGLPGQPGQPAYPVYPAYAAPVYPPHPGYPGQPPARRGRWGVRVGVAVVAAVAVLACIGVGVYALTKDDGHDRTTAGAQRGPEGRDGRGQGPGDGGPGEGGPGSGGQASPAPSEAPKIDSGSATDAASGISLPIPDGWYGQEFGAGAAVTSDSSYPCPGAASQTCTKGGAYAAPATLLGVRGTTAEEVAKADIAGNAEQSYGGATYGAITSHQVLASKAVTVAGQKGYLVRWKAVTGKGADGVVESLAFPSPASPRMIVLVRFGVDADQDVAVIDRITQGIRQASGGGSGQNV
ncbi:hypothetical protein [Streptomyces sp. NPDC014806]|uniref:hypothetical protein n=1 Tax=Streptomyces sp. NPDC014806 TaxID=3364920 RepID=UPI0036F84853